MTQTIFPGVTFTSLKKIKVVGGDVYHGLKCGDSSYTRFGELYFSFIENGAIKGWKQHKVMRLNLMVPVGAVEFFIHCERENRTVSLRIGDNNYGRLTIDPGYWVAFSGISDGINMLANLASIEHEPKEAINVDIDRFSLS
ncbi:MAG: dTDP-4-dehydrorhamnose 3,5-epimerase [Chloroflexota bacterium]|nr:dTDP-4-dehydrorhamnose 3,5-epimerase [Chloroflexota bacterium]